MIVPTWWNVVCVHIPVVTPTHDDRSNAYLDGLIRAAKIIGRDSQVIA
jgi:hypothetical protein